MPGMPSHCSWGAGKVPSAMSVQVTGTLYDPKVQTVLFESIGQQMRELLIGDYREANNLPANK